MSCGGTKSRTKSRSLTFVGPSTEARTRGSPLATLLTVGSRRVPHVHRGRVESAQLAVRQRREPAGGRSAEQQPCCTRHASVNTVSHIPRIEQVRRGGGGARPRPPPPAPCRL